MPLPLTCTCGREFRVPDTYVGRKVKCPACDALLLVPETGYKSAPPRFGRDDTLEMSAPRPLPAPRHRGAGLGLLLALVVGLLLVGGMIFGIMAVIKNRQKGGPKAGDLVASDVELIPHDAAGFVSVRLAEVYDHDAVKKAITEIRLQEPGRLDPGVALEREIGLKPAEVERLTAVLIDGTKRIGWLALLTKGDLDRARVLTRLRGQEERVYQGISYHVGQGVDGTMRALLIAGARVLVIGNEDSIKRCIDHAIKPETEGPLTPAIAKVDDKIQIVFGGDPRSNSLDAIREGPAGQQIKKVFEARLLRGTLELKDKATLDAALVMDTEANASSLKTQLQWGKLLLPALLRVQGDKPGLEGLAAKGTIKMLKDIRIKNEGKEVTVTGKTDVNTAVLVLMALWPG